MLLQRVDGDKNVSKTVEILELIIEGQCYTLTERFGKLNILSHDDSMSVSPCCANQIDVK